MISDCLALFNYKTKGYCVALFVETCMVVYHKVSYLNVRSFTEEEPPDYTKEVVFPSVWVDSHYSQYGYGQQGSPMGFWGTGETWNLMAHFNICENGPGTWEQSHEFSDLSYNRQKNYWGREPAALRD